MDRQHRGVVFLAAEASPRDGLSHGHLAVVETQRGLREWTNATAENIRMWY